MRDAERNDGVRQDGVRQQDVVVPPQTVAARPLPVGEAGPVTGRDPSTDELPVQQKAPAHDMDPRTAGKAAHESTPDQRTGHAEQPAEHAEQRVEHAERRVEHAEQRKAREQQNGHAPRRPADGESREDGQHAELFPGDTVSKLRARWRELQADFVDDPQRAVRGADEVVDEVLRTITEHRKRLAGGWQGQEDTERLRLAMREYRTFVDRLLPTA